MEQGSSQRAGGAPEPAAQRVRPPLPYADPPPPSRAVLARHNARLLDPTTAWRLPGQRAPRTTAYVADRLLVGDATLNSGSRAVLDRAANDLGLTLTVLPTPRRLERVEDSAGLDLVRRVRLEPTADNPGPVAAPDAWAVLQRARALARRNDVGASLDHLMQVGTGPDIGGNPYTNPMGRAFDPASDYGLPGHGARTPVAWIGAAPKRTTVAGRRPRVAVLDTGTAEHAWFDAPEQVGCLIRVDMIDSPFASEQSGVENPLQGVLAADAGHGTFIAGLIRQACPDADIVSIRIMGDDGVVAEGVLIEALQLLLDTHLNAQQHADPRGVVDVVSLSLGYYHEHPEDTEFDALLLLPLRGLADAGVSVVASAGNDATSRPLYPAAFTPNVNGPLTACAPSSVPMIGVGALNPDRSTALFSNDGPWVCASETGASVVSTMPALDGSAQAPYRVGAAGARQNIDPDNFAGGYAAWSGTSFAAPILAGKIAQHVLDAGGLDDLSAASAVTRSRDAVAALTSVPL